MEDFSKRNYRRGTPGKEGKGQEEAGCLQGTATLIMQTYKRTHRLGEELVLCETVARVCPSLLFQLFSDLMCHLRFTPHSVAQDSRL